MVHAWPMAIVGVSGKTLVAAGIFMRAALWLLVGNNVTQAAPRVRLTAVGIYRDATGPLSSLDCLRNKIPLSWNAPRDYSISGTLSRVLDANERATFRRFSRSRVVQVSGWFPNLLVFCKI